MNLCCSVTEKICEALPDLIPFVKFKKHEKHSWGSPTFSKAAGFSHMCFSRFLNCENGAKTGKITHIMFV